MKEKWYAVRIGRNPGIYRTWEDCKKETAGFSGAIYKSFPSQKEAEAFLNAEETGFAPKENQSEEWNRLAEEKIRSLGPDEAIAFVDGSYDAENEAGGFGVIYLEQNGKETLLQGGFTAKDHPELTKLRNVAAELLGVRAAADRALYEGKKKLLVFYDYAGIEHWARGTWKTNLKFTADYAAHMQELQKELSITFQKVPAHTGVSYNEKADQLAKKAVKEQLSPAQPDA